MADTQPFAATDHAQQLRLPNRHRQQGSRNRGRRFGQAQDVFREPAARLATESNQGPTVRQTTEPECEVDGWAVTAEDDRCFWNSVSNTGRAALQQRSGDQPMGPDSSVSRSLANQIIAAWNESTEPLLPDDVPRTLENLTNALACRARSAGEEAHESDAANAVRGNADLQEEEDGPTCLLCCEPVKVVYL